MISKRLEAIASLVDKRVKVFDVGCDHGYLSIYLAKTNDNTVVASDVTKYSVDKTIENVKNENCDIEVILSDGLDKLDISKKDTIVISGMGTSTMIKIFKKNISKLSDTLILQSNNNHYDLRKEVVKLGYYISFEKTVYENNRLYTIIKFEKGRKKYNFYDYLFGPFLINDSVYMKKQLSIYEKMYTKLPKKLIFKRIKTKFIINKIKRSLQSL